MLEACRVAVQAKNDELKVLVEAAEKLEEELMTRQRIAKQRKQAEAEQKRQDRVRILVQQQKRQQ